MDYLEKTRKDAIEDFKTKCKKTAYFEWLLEEIEKDKIKESIFNKLIGRRK